MIKKIIYIIGVGIITIACKNNTNEGQEVIAEETLETNTEEIKKTITGSLSDFNRLIEDEEDGGMMLLGKIDREGLEADDFTSWYQENYKGHSLDTITTQQLKPYIEGITIKVFMGTWCEDSQREIPALFKVLDTVKFDKSNLDLVAVTHDKVTPQGYEEGYNIEYVPTIIFMKDRKELNRIVEYTQVTLEKDMLAILTGADYTPGYAD